MLMQDGEQWTASDSSELYDVERWGKGYFSVSRGGRLFVHPGCDPAEGIDMVELVGRLQARGLEPPILLRFDGILRHRMIELREAFARAARDHDYQGRYCCVYPIKVNQQRRVVEKVIEYGREFGFGLEAGSKPELLAVVAMTDAETPVICNGFKDSEFIEMAMLAQKMGQNVIPVVERYGELELILHHATRLDVRPQLGIRVKLASRGAGRWQASGGLRSKFGLTVTELLSALRELESRGMADGFKLLHFHMGSQMTNIRQIKGAMIEAARIYVDLVRRGAGLEYLDVGGGLGVDYDGSQTNFPSSVNYSLQEYANDVVYHLHSVCQEQGVAHPHIISESGRAIAAYHSVLIFDVLGGTNNNKPRPLEPVPADSPQPVRLLDETLENLSRRNLLESFHDAQIALEMAINLFNTGHLTLDQRSLTENLFWAVCRRIREEVASLDYTPEELEGLDRMMSDVYFCNFSLFQSIPDSWAIRQLFPLMPIHRLDERPTRHAVLGDITCDSDGKIDQFIGLRDVRRTLLLHDFDEGGPYYLGAFLIGAYQEILGDLHNLFGDTNTAHVDWIDGQVALEAVVKGDTVNEVLQYVQFQGRDLIHRLQGTAETAVRTGRLTHFEAGRMVKFYEDALNSYTYLKTP